MATGSDGRVLSREVEDALISVFGEVPPLPAARETFGAMRRAVAGNLYSRDFADDEALSEFLEDEINRVMSDRIRRRLLEAFGYGPDLVKTSFVSGPQIEFDETTTLLDYDIDLHAELEWYAVDAGKRPDGPGPYVESLFSAYVTWAEGEDVVHGFAYTAGNWLYTVLEDAMLAYVHDRYPIDMKKMVTADELGEDLQRQIENPTGHERSLTEASRRGSKLMTVMLADELLSSMFAGDEPWVSVRRSGDAPERNEQLVFSNRKALAKVRFANIRADIAALPDRTDVLDARAASVAEDYLARLAVICDLMDAGQPMPE